MPRAKKYPPQDDPPTGGDGGLLALIQPDPLVWLYAIDIPSSPRTKLRVMPYPAPVKYQQTSLGADIEYSPASIFHEDVVEDVEGSIPRTRLVIQNLSREAIALFEEYDGLIGEKVRIVAVRLSELPLATPQRDEVHDVLDSNATETLAELQLGRVALTQRKLPERQASRLHCAHLYGRAGCGYDTSRGGAIQTCTKLLDGTNGCTEHGLDEAAAGLPNRHPKRILLFRGIPRTSGVGVS